MEEEGVCGGRIDQILIKTHARKGMVARESTGKSGHRRSFLSACELRSEHSPRFLWDMKVNSWSRPSRRQVWKFWGKCQIYKYRCKCNLQSFSWNDPREPKGGLNLKYWEICNFSERGKRKTTRGGSPGGHSEAKAKGWGLGETICREGRWEMTKLTQNDSLFFWLV